MNFKRILLSLILLSCISQNANSGNFFEKHNDTIAKSAGIAMCALNNYILHKNTDWIRKNTPHTMASAMMLTIFAFGLPWAVYDKIKSNSAAYLEKVAKYKKKMRAKEVPEEIINILVPWEVNY